MRAKYLLLAFLFLIAGAGTKAQVDVGDSLALVDLYNSTGGAGWANHTNWLTQMPVSSWYGISVANKRVTAINMTDNGLTGTLPVSIGNLTGLEYFYAMHNRMVGAIPSSIGNLINLIEIDLGGNYLTGGLPSSIGNLAKLKVLYAYENQLTDSLPSSIGNLENLEVLSLGYNAISGSIPSSIGNLHNLDFLALFHNRLTGSIPSSIGNLSLLSSLDLNTNLLTGELPVSLKKLTKLAYVHLEYNHLTQDRNADLWRLFVNRAVVVDIDDNRFTFNGTESLGNKPPFWFRCSEQAPLAVHQHDGGLAVSAGGTLRLNTYSWHRVGEKHSTNVRGDSSFQPSQSGQYYATISNALIDQLVLTTDTVAYTAPFVKNELKLLISPNPARGMITIQGLSETMNAKITIADMSGYVWANAMSHRQTQMKIDVSRLKTGNYVVTVNEGNDIKTILFMKK